LILFFAISKGVLVTQCNLLVNGGFDTDGIAGWTFIGASSGSDFEIAGGNTGCCSAGFGAVRNIDDVLQQTITTTPGAQYTLSFFINSGEGSDNHVAVKWNGVAVFDQTNFVTASWTPFSFPVTATATSTVVELRGYNGPSFSDVDTVSVVPLVPVVSQAILVPSTIKVGFAKIPYKATLQLQGGDISTFSNAQIVGGSEVSLPTGISISGPDANGVITFSGTTTQSGLFSFIVSVSNSAGCPITGSYTLQINSAFPFQSFEDNTHIASKGLSKGAIAGIVIGCVVGAGILAAAGFVIVKFLFL